MIRISIVIPTPVDNPYDFEQSGNYFLLSKCLNSLVRNKSDRFEYEFLVIGNAWTGFEANVNRGFRMATGDYIWLINDDIEIEKGVDERMVDAFTEGVGLVSATDYANTEWEEQGLPSYWNVMFSRACLETVGHLDGNYETFSSDHDHALRVSKAGFKIVHTGVVGVKHARSQTVKRLKDEQGLKERAREKFLAKWKL